MPKKIPMRTCIGCGAVRPKKELIRIVMTPEGEIIPDRTGRANGRGAYLCNDPACLLKAQKRRGMERAFRRPEARDASVEALAKQIGEPDAG